MKVAVIGYGSIARKHIVALAELQFDAEIFTLRSQDPSPQIQNVKNIYSYTDLHKATPDFVIISNPTAQHYEAIQNVKALNVPLFIEKPLFSGVGDKQSQLVNDLEQSHKTYVACNLRFLEVLQKIRHEIKDARINEVNVYCGSYLPDWRPVTDFRKVYSANKNMGGGVHIDLIHELDYLYWIFGKPLNTFSHFSNDSSLAISANDYANYLWQYEGFSANVILNYYRRQPKRILEVVTENDIYVVDLIKNNITRNGDIFFQSSDNIAGTYKKQMKFFVENIVKGERIFNPVKEAYQILKLCLEKA